MENFHNPLEYNWSERKDSNLRPPAPKAGALPGCATLRKKTRAVACAGAGNLWGERWDLNPRPPGPQPGALPTELLPPRESSYKQDNFFWQDFFSEIVVWILSRKKTTLRQPPREAACGSAPALDGKPVSARSHSSAHVRVCPTG